MRERIRLYVRYVAASVRGQMQYRASFLMLSAGSFLITGVEFLVLWALFARFGQIRGWTLPEVALLYGMVNVSFALAEAAGRGFDVFDQQVKSGDFDRLLLRPRSTAFQVAAQSLQMMRVGRLLQGLVVLVWATNALDVSWSPLTMGVLLASVLCGGCLFYGLFVLQATMSFWTIQTLEIMNTVTYGGVEAGQYPIAIYRPGFRRFFTFVIPLACVNYFPAMAILGRVGPLGYLAPLAGPAFLIVALSLWQVGVRHYRSTGS
jgi:viologen exporter family transport system permease protein